MKAFKILFAGFVLTAALAACQPQGSAPQATPTAIVEEPTAMPASKEPTAMPVSEKPTATPTSEKPTATPTNEKPTEAPAQPTVAPTEEPTATPETKPAEPVILAAGEFQGRDAAHQGSGTAQIVQEGERRVLRLQNFSSTEGPDLYVYLVENPDTFDADAVGEYLDLGLLKATTGDQEYEIPAGADLAKYGGVQVYCLSFRFIFSNAPFVN